MGRMMNNNEENSRTDNHSLNAMEQAALLRARSAIARWRCCDPMEAALDGKMKQTYQDARVRWYHELERGLHAWIADGGLAQKTSAPGEASGRTEQHPCVG